MSSSRRERQDEPASLTLGVVSPHLDDAWLSCARLIAAHPGAHVITVFAGGPTSMTPLTSWDRRSACFRDGDDVLRVRRNEDRRSADVLGATSHHLPFWDRQYRIDRYSYEGPTGEELPECIARALAILADELQPDVWIVPLGICHGDHEAVGTACLELARDIDGTFYVYEELPYRVETPKEVEEAVRRLHRAGFELERDRNLPAEGSLLKKMEAVRCHRSQLRALAPRRVLRAIFGSERIWRLVWPGRA